MSGRVSLKKQVFYRKPATKTLDKIMKGVKLFENGKII